MRTGLCISSVYVFFVCLFLQIISEKTWDRKERTVVMKSPLNYLNAFQVTTPESYTGQLSKLILMIPTRNSGLSLTCSIANHFICQGICYPAIRIFHYHLFDFYNSEICLGCFDGWVMLCIHKMREKWLQIRRWGQSASRISPQASSQFCQRVPWGTDEGTRLLEWDPACLWKDFTHPSLKSLSWMISTIL